MKEHAPVQRFVALSEIGVIEHGFILRVPGLDVRTDRESALQRLEHYHRERLAEIGTRPLKLAQQIHGNGVAAVDKRSPVETKQVDGLVTTDPEVVLGIHVADCCAIFLVDPVRRAIGLVHSGKKGTEQNVVGTAVRKMRTEFRCEPANVVAVLSPCIRPPYYEIDFAKGIAGQLRAENVRHIYDDGENTGADLVRFYSYRIEKGRTGRMLAYLALRT